MNGMSESILKKLNDIFMISHHKHNIIAPMEGMRAFAAFMVFLVHFAAQSQVWVTHNTVTADIIFYLRFIGATGVDLFFVLSGFLIYGMLIRKEIKLSTYVYRRLKRIYPAFLLVLFLYLILSLIFPSESKLPDTLYNTIIYIIQCALLLPGIFDIRPIFSVAWTLSYELFFYISTPILILLLGLRNWSKQQRVLLLILLAIMGFIICWDNVKHIELLMFISGMLLFELQEIKINPKWNKAHFILPLTIILMIYIRHAFDFKFTWLITLIMFFGYGLVCLDTFRQDSKLGKFFSILPLRWYGNMSYSYYLIHGLTLKFLFLILAIIIPPQGQDTWVFYVLLIPCFVGTLTVSFILFYFIEKPYSFGKKK